MMPMNLPGGQTEWGLKVWNSEGGPGYRLYINGIQSSNSLNGEGCVSTTSAEETPKRLCLGREKGPI